MTTEKPPGVLSDRNVLRYLLGQMGSFTGSMLQGAVLSLLVISLTDKEEAARAVGYITAFNVLPGVLLAPFAGLLVDRWNKRNMLVLTALVYSVQTIVLMVMTWNGSITISWIYALALLSGFATAFDGNARNAILKDIIVNQEHMKQTSKMLTSLYTIAQIAGPGLAGYLVLLIGYSGSFMLNLLSNVGLIISLFNTSLIVPYVSPTTPLRLIKPALGGLKHIFQSQQIRLCVLLMTVVCTFGFAYQFLLPVIAKYMLHGDAILYSHLAASNGIGCLVGSFISIAFNHRLSHKSAVILGMAMTGAASIALASTVNTYLASVYVFCAGMGVLISFGSLRGSFNHLLDRSVIGLAGGWMSTFSYGGIAVSSGLGGYFADKGGCPLVLSACGIVLLVAAAVTPFLKGVEKL